MADIHVVIDGCATPAGGDVRAIRTRDSAFGKANWHFNPERIVNGLPVALTERQLDWLELNSAIHAADLVVNRDPGLDWNRSIELHVPLRDPRFWEDHTATLADIFNSLTYDRLEINVYPGGELAGPPRTRKEPFAEASCVALVSGGMDSFVGALELLSRDQRPMLLAASGSGATGAAQGRVATALKGEEPSLEMLKLVAQRKPGFPGKEDSQRARTLLYLACAALTASASGLQDVYLNENGIMAIHVPLTAARQGSYSTHTASPRVLAQIAELASRVLGSEIRISNLLLEQTKGEVAARGVELGHRDTLKDTISCWSISRHPTHCGYCAPCITRRLASLTHSIPDVAYEVDVLNDRDALERDDALDTLTHMIMTAEAFRDEDDFELLMSHAEILGGAFAPGADAALALYRRWAGEVLSVLEAHPVPRSLMS